MRRNLNFRSSTRLIPSRKSWYMTMVSSLCFLDYSPAARPTNWLEIWRLNEVLRSEQSAGVVANAK